MCTVSWCRQAEGYVLLCNRDEHNTRKPASGPRVGVRRAISFVSPVDGDHEGSWIGVNQFGLTLCLLNRYGDWAPDPDWEYVSRGLLLMDLIDCRDGQEVTKRVSEVEIEEFQPFSMLALSIDNAAILISWNGVERTVEFDAETRMPLTSSSLREPNVEASRRKLFADVLLQKGTIDADLLRQFHRSHLPERGPYSVCMHRDDAATVSLSIVTVTRDTVEFVYHPNAPCLETAAARVAIDRKRPDGLQIVAKV